MDSLWLISMKSYLLFYSFSFSPFRGACTSGVLRLRKQHDSLWDQNFYDCFKQGLKLGCTSPNDAPRRRPLLQRVFSIDTLSSYFSEACGPAEL